MVFTNVSGKQTMEANLLIHINFGGVFYTKLLSNNLIKKINVEIY